ncbi:MAG TPA: molybdopterin cofactor-binding domain-containing protein, partial [Burkholderiales bacterium]|nr:molybdopterin cofactor-binding domain-containing protein [Burkholderiales bacterium]
MNDMTNPHLQNPARRDFIVKTAAAGGGLALGFNLHGLTGEALAQGAAASATPELNAWVAIKPDDTVVIRIARSEMGQGTLTGLAQLVAEELDCDWSKVKTEHINPGQNLANKRVWGDMSTGGSRGIRTSQDYVRRAGASARMMLLQAAADEWKVPVGELTVDKGVISHAGSSRTTTYGKVADAASKLKPPEAKTLKLRDPRQWKIAGKPVKRLDTADKLDGSKIYAVDVKLPNMLCAAIKDCPVFGGKLVSFDQAKIANMPGKPQALRVNESAVAVVADTWWRAKKALDALPVVWDEGANAKVSQASILAHLSTGLDSTDAFADINDGDVDAAIKGAAKKVTAVYTSPFVPHICMEPMNATVRLSTGKAECWVATQNAESSMATLSQTSGLPLNQCEVYKLDLGGGFGRRGGNQDFVRQATLIAKQLPEGTAVKMLWSREEDLTHDFYRPIAQAKLSAGIDAQGNLVGLNIRVAGQSINAFANPVAIKDGKDTRQLQGLWKEPGDAQIGYAPANLRTEYAMRNTHVPVGAWRGVNTNQNGFFLECFMEECAKAAGKDSLEFRRALMQKHPKHLGVLNAAAEKAGWGKPLPAGRHRGIAQFMGYGSYSAAVAEVSVSPKGEVKVHRMVLATNCGHAVSVEQIAAQVQGGVGMGISTLMGQSSV